MLWLLCDEEGLLPNPGQAAGFAPGLKHSGFGFLSGCTTFHKAANELFVLEVVRVCPAMVLGAGKAVLDVDADNSRAIKLYERFGYVIESPASSMKTFEYYRMNKTLK